MSYRAHLVPSLGALADEGADAAFRALADAAPVFVHAKSRTTDTSVIVLPGASRVVRKMWRWPRRGDRVKGVLRTTFAATSPARREFEALVRLAALPGGPFAPAPLAWAERRAHGVLQECLILTAEIADATDFAVWLRDTRGAARRTTVVRRLAERTREMHDAGLADCEMHPRNVIVGPDDAVFKVDCAKQTRTRRGASQAARARDLAALDVGLARLASPAERAAFFAAYGASQALVAAAERERARIDARESKRLPARG